MTNHRVTSPEGEIFELIDEDAMPSRTPVEPGEHLERLWSTKEGNVFVCADAEGNINPSTSALAGMYCRDTRHLSEFMFLVNGRIPTLLSTSAERVFMSHVDLTNPELAAGRVGEQNVPPQTVNVRRVRVVRDRLHERIRVRNYHNEPVQIRLTMTFGADFADILQVRGTEPTRRGRRTRPKVLPGGGIVFAYDGADGQFRETRIQLDPAPEKAEIREDRVVAFWRLRLEPGEMQLLWATVEPRSGGVHLPSVTFDAAANDLRRSYDAWDRSCTQVTTSSQVFDGLLARGRRDLRALRTPTEHGDILAAGIPWYVAPFGRDSLLAAHQTLMVNPDLARSTLSVLAAYQGTKVDAERDEEPGKILHELRQGELSRSGSLPSAPSYSTVDATPLWLLLLGTYWRWTADEDFCRSMLPQVDRALTWMDEYGDRDGDGLLEYQSSAARGLRHHGWKDSDGAVVHPDGTPVEGPVALAEVQGYAYLARQRIADLLEALGQRDRAASLRARAAETRKQFNELFWVESEQYFALALDGDKRPVGTVTSNPAHALYCDVVDPDKAALMARRLLSPDMFSGWGIRTMSKTMAAYNPMSHHNGSVWPHDNAIIAAGLKRYGFATSANRVATAMLDVAASYEDLRLPELFCGFTRRTRSRPVAYPVASSPQAWAAGAPFMLLQTMLGLSARAPEKLLTVNNPRLPRWLQTVELRNLRVGDAKLSLLFTRRGDNTGFSLLDRDGDVRVLMQD